MASDKVRTGVSLGVDGKEEFVRSLGEINRELKASQAELNLTTAAYGKNEKNIDTLTARKKHLDNAIRLNKEEQQALNRQLAEATEKYGANSREVQVLETKLQNAQAKGVGLTRQLGETTAALEAQERALKGASWTKFGQQAEAAGKKMQAAGQRMTDTGRALSMGVTAPLLAVGTAALAVGTDYQSSMNTIQARTGMVVEEVDNLGNAFRAMALSGDYGSYTAREIAAAYAGIAIAGHDAGHATEIMRMSMVLATAVGDDLGSTASFLGDYLNKVGKDAGYAEKYINLFAEANQRTGIGLNTLQDYLFRANASLQAASISGTEATAIFSQLYQAGIKGANAYSGFSQAIQGIMLPSDKAREALEALGISNSDYYVAQGKTLDLLFKVTEALEGVEDSTQRLDLMTTIFTQGSAQAFMDGLGDNRDLLRDVIPHLEAASKATDGLGTAFEMAAIKQGGLGAEGQNLRASLEEIMLQISQHLMPHAVAFLGTVSRWIERFASLDESTQRNIIRFAALAAAIGPVLAVGGKFVTTISAIAIAVGKMSTAIGAAGGAKMAFAAKFPLATKAMVAFKGKMGLLGVSFAALNVKMKAGSASLVAYAATQKAMGVSSGILTGGLTAVKAAFIKLTVAMLANPIGLIIAGVAALAAGIAYLIIRARRVTEEYQEMGEEAAKLAARQQELTDAAAANADAFRNSTQQMQDQNQHLRNLADSVAYLSEKQELSAGEAALLERQIAELNESVPGLTLAYDAQAGALNLGAEALQNYLRQAEKRAAIDAQLEERLRLEHEAIELSREAMAVAEQREALEEKLNDGTNRRRADRRALEAAIQDLVTAEEGYMAALEANGEMHEAVADSIEIYAQALADMEAAQQAAIGAIGDANEAMGNNRKSAEEWAKAQEDALQHIERIYEQYHRVATNAFATVSEAAAVSVQEMTANLQDNARAVEEWSKNIAVLVERGVDEGLIKQLRAGGVETAATVRALVEASDEELDALNDAFESSTRVAMESMKRELDPTGVAESAQELIDTVANAIMDNDEVENALLTQITTAFDSMGDKINTIGFDGLGEDTVEGYVQGIENRLNDVDAAGKDIGETYADALKASLEQNSPSRVTERIGVGAVEGLMQGTEKMQPRAVETAKTLARAFIAAVADSINNSNDIDNATRRTVEEMRRTADSAVNAANFFSVGMEMANGVANGINGGGGIVSNAASNLINNALNAMRQASAINSPSRKAREIAQHIGSGLIVGLTEKGKELADACKRITDKVMDNLYIDPGKLMADAGGALQSLQTALPALESNMRHTTGERPAPPSQGSGRPIHVHITGNEFVIREENDIEKVAKRVVEMISDEVDDESRIGGIRFA